MNYTNYTRSELRAAFEKVEDKSDWKNPIDATIDVAELDVTVNAIRFFTGTESNWQLIPNTSQVRIRAIGYRSGPAGDH